MFTFFLILQAILAILLIIVVLIQPGEGESFMGGGNASSAFGADTGAVLTKTTAILGALFMLNSLILSIVGSKYVERSSVVQKVKVNR